eukprot:TRINITY_DN5166_c1_g1_i2.p1 TRINITY_DN5166_c1_g1~~TRINITY_DN5166_c1_g1_i2.p1  ORF type:complete len:739 (+),score=173.72 TRINITY_DN5166_c1_g1_i2:319-2217(+)
MYSSVIRMSTENKITAKNAWQLNLIDYMGDVLEQQKEGDEGDTNFVIASSTLDASVKIYSSRVDAVHTETYSVLTHLTRTEHKRGDDDDDDDGPVHVDADADGDNDGDAPADADPAAQTKRSRRALVGGVNTLETNMDNITAKKIDAEFMVDPLFRKTSAAFDEGGARGLLLNHLSVYRGCELIFDSVDAIDAGGPSDTQAEQVGDEEVDLSELQQLLGGDDWTTLDICPTFRNFHFSAANESILSSEAPNAYVDEGSSAAVGADGGDSDDDGPDHGFPDLPMGDDDQQDDNNDANEGGNTFVDRILNETSNDGTFEEVDDEGNIFRTGDDSWRDYAYVDPKLLRNWAGPAHWKQSALRQAKAVSEDAEEKRPTKKESTLNFIEDPEPPKELFEPPGKKGASTTLSIPALKKQETANNTLPDDQNYVQQDLFTLFNNKTVGFRGKRRAAHLDGSDGDGGAHEGGLHQGDDDDDNDDGDVVGYNGNEMAADDDNDGGAGINFFAGDAPGLDGDDGLIAEPAKVPKTFISYAKVAKKVDVKALKASLWSKLCQASEASEAASTAVRDAAEASRTLAMPDGPRDFVDMLGGIKAQPAIGEVSVAMCFICLLHLANEKGLELKQTSMDNLSILPGR